MISSRMLAMLTRFGGRFKDIYVFPQHVSSLVTVSIHNKICSGYFTSRAAMKRNIREHEGYLQAARALDFIQGDSIAFLLYFNNFVFVLLCG